MKALIYMTYRLVKEVELPDEATPDQMAGACDEACAPLWEAIDAGGLGGAHFGWVSSEVRDEADETLWEVS